MKRFSAHSKFLAATVAAFVAVTGPATAADMLEDGKGYDNTTTNTLVEFGTGWYLRGDVGGGLGSIDVGTNFTATDADLGTPITFGVAAGYDTGSGQRYEIALNQFTNLGFASRFNYASCGNEEDPNIPGNIIPVTGECFNSTTADVNASSVMLNAYWDLATIGRITPYVGVGAGVAYVSWGDFRWIEGCVGTQSVDCGAGGGVGTSTRAAGVYEADDGFTYAANLMLGASFDLTKNTKLDVGYRYTYIGETGAARAVDNPFNRGDFEVDAMDVHEVRVGLRYAIW